MKTLTKVMLTATAAISGISAATAANAALVININQVGADLVATGSGTINTTGLTLVGSAGYSTIIRGTGGAVFVGPQVDTQLYQNAFTTTSGFGSGSDVAATSGTGNTFGIYGAFGYLLTPVGYVSGSALSGTATYANTTFASAGINQGTYIYNLTNGDRVTVNIGQQAGAVPETATWAMMIAGFGMMGAAMRTRRRSTKETFA